MDEKTILLFDDYLQGALSPEAKVAFESRLKTEPALNDAFIIFSDVNQHLSHRLSEERATFKSSLETIADQHLDASVVSKKEVKVIRLKPLRYLVAACVVLVFGAIFWTQMQRASYGEYAFDGAIDLVERGGDESAFAKAETAFNAKEYQEAITYFDAILVNDPDNSEVLFYKGIASVEIAKYAQAEQIFVDLHNGNSVFKYKAQWYNALNFLKQGDTGRCKQLLEDLPQEAEDYKKAQELLKKL